MKRFVSAVMLAAMLAVGVGYVMTPNAVGRPVDDRAAQGVTGGTCYFYSGQQVLVCTGGTHYICIFYGGSQTVNLIQSSNILANQLQSVSCPCSGSGVYQQLNNANCSPY